MSDKSKLKKITLKDFLEEKSDLSEKSKKLKNGCIPARRRIASGGKAGSYADQRTGGKQAYAALKAAKPLGSKGGWTKKNCICCHKCPNDRSAPNGYVCTNPAHLYWGSKADNTYDQNRGNGWASKNVKSEMSADEKAFSAEIMVSESSLNLLISKIIKESYLSEDVFGKDFFKFKEAVDGGEEPIRWAKKNLEKIGEGSTRVVFKFSDNPSMILKIANTDQPAAEKPFKDSSGEEITHYDEEGKPRTVHGFFKSHMQQSNQWEADLIMQQKFPDVFPRTYEHSDDFTWIVSEKAIPFKENDYDKLFKILGIRKTSFEKNNKTKRNDLLNLVKQGMDYFSNPDHFLRSLKENKSTFVDDDYSDVEKGTTKFNLLPKDVSKIGDQEFEEELFDDQEASTSDMYQDLKDLISRPHNRKILGAMIDLKIPPREFLPKNLGISLITGKLLIIDASLWEKHRKIRE